MTPLIFAALFGRDEVVQLLLVNGADTTLKDNAGRTAEAVAREKAYTRIAEMLRKQSKK